MLKLKKARSNILVVIFMIFIILSAYYSYHFFNKKKNAETYQMLVENGIIEQGEDVNLDNYNIENINWVGGSSSSGGGSGGGGGGGGAISLPVIPDNGISFTGMWISDNDEGEIGGENEA